MTTHGGRGTQAARRTRPAEADGMAVSKLVAVRVPDALLERIDAHRQKLRELTGLEPSRSEVIKMLIERGIASVEADAHPSRKR